VTACPHVHLPNWKIGRLNVLSVLIRVSLNIGGETIVTLMIIFNFNCNTHVKSNAITRNNFHNFYYKYIKDSIYIMTSLSHRVSLFAINEY